MLVSCSPIVFDWAVDVSESFLISSATTENPFPASPAWAMMIQDLKKKTTSLENLQKEYQDLENSHSTLLKETGSLLDQLEVLQKENEILKKSLKESQI